MNVRGVHNILDFDGWFSIVFGSFYRFTAELEKSIVSVERVKEYQFTPQEAPFRIQEVDPEPDWPYNGEIEFIDYATRYR